MWYVIQTTAGHEEDVRNKASMLIPEVDFKVIYRTGKYNYKGKWISKKKIMFTGYVFAVTDDIGVITGNIWKIIDFAKPVRFSEEYLPISCEEQKFLERLMGDDGIVEESTGIIEGDEIIVREGPLVGLESRIVRIDRHKRLAYIEIEMCDRKVEAQLSLSILEKKPADQDTTA